MNLADKPWLGLPLGAMLGCGVLFALNQWLQPVPIAAGPAFIAAAISFTFTRHHRARWSLLALLGGGLGGMLLHWDWHRNGHSAATAEGLWQHLSWETFVGIIAASLALSAMMLISGRSLRDDR